MLQKRETGRLDYAGWQTSRHLPAEGKRLLDTVRSDFGYLSAGVGYLLVTLASLLHPMEKVDTSSPAVEQWQTRSGRGTGSNASRAHDAQGFGGC